MAASLILAPFEIRRSAPAWAHARPGGMGETRPSWWNRGTVGGCQAIRQDIFQTAVECRFLERRATDERRAASRGPLPGPPGSRRDGVFPAAPIRGRSSGICGRPRPASRSRRLRSCQARVAAPREAGRPAAAEGGIPRRETRRAGRGGADAHGWRRAGMSVRSRHERATGGPAVAISFRDWVLGSDRAPWRPSGPRPSGVVSRDEA